MRSKARSFFFLALLLASVTRLSAETVYVSKTGHKYHATAQCWALARSKNPQAITIEEAKRRGLEPCKVCYKAAKPTDARGGK